MQKKITQVEQYIEKHSQWQALLVVLREILLSAELQETIKWGAPVYTYNGKNVVGLSAFKHYAGLWFFNGALLQDSKKLLQNAQQGKTKGMRQWRFADISEVNPELVRAYVDEAVRLQKQGKVVAKAKPSTQFDIPEELADALAEDKALAQQFEQLTSYKQKEFAVHIAAAKRQATRESRLQKAIPLILSGVGLNDKYRNC